MLIAVTGMLPNEYTLATVLTCCSGTRNVGYGREIHAIAVKTGLSSHVFVGSSLLDMYAKTVNVTEARIVFDGLTERDVVSCTAMISGYAQLGFDEEALHLFRKLYAEGMPCNYVTFTSLLNALSGLAAMDYGKQVHTHIFRRDFPYYIILQNSLIDMYAKCGDLVYARRVFDIMQTRTVMSWNAMIVGYGKHGTGLEAVELFYAMCRELKPDSVTIMAVLSGCSHSGMVDEGLNIFDIAIREYGEMLHIGHYGCVIDILGRVGSIEKALNFIKSMQYEPTVAMWGSLLGACRAHGNAKVGEYVAQKLLSIEPENSGNYVILSNIYAAGGKWLEVMRVRKSMIDNTVSKEPGKSCIIIDKVIQTFYSNDHLHPKIDDIEAQLENVHARIKEAGYVIDLSCVLHDVDDEEKERLLLRHSEKLALVFGLMSSKEGTPVRVIKNLRICVDCHNFAKFVSKLYKREISLRDKSRFHLFAHGSCSCRDFW